MEPMHAATCNAKNTQQCITDNTIHQLKKKYIAQHNNTTSVRPHLGAWRRALSYLVFISNIKKLPFEKFWRYERAPTNYQ